MVGQFTQFNFLPTSMFLTLSSMSSFCVFLSFCLLPQLVLYASHISRKAGKSPQLCWTLVSLLFFILKVNHLAQVQVLWQFRHRRPWTGGFSTSISWIAGTVHSERQDRHLVTSQAAMGLSVPILGCRQTLPKGALFPRPKFPVCFLTCHRVCSDVGGKEEDPLQTVSKNCPTELYKKALDVIKLKASPKVIGCFPEALKRRLSEPRGEARSCLQGLKQACCHYPAFTCQLASPSPPAVACLNRYPLPESSVSLEYRHCETVLCWSGLPRLQADSLSRGTEDSPCGRSPVSVSSGPPGKMTLSRLAAAPSQRDP